MCHNSNESKSNCLSEIETSLADSNLSTAAHDLYKKYLPVAQETYDQFFQVEKIRTDFSPFLEFIKGVTPYVSGKTYNKITMDPDYSLDDYDTQWTIRHEFGHVLGFPDCYLEFFDPDKKEMTYYTIEPDNLC